MDMLKNIMVKWRSY